MPRCLFLLITILLCVACGGNRHIRETLDDVETYIESRPDSALAVLQAFDQEQLCTPSEKAKHALLLSIALDKNYIDKTDFTALQPALDYYGTHGPKKYKFLTYYYAGVICDNANNNEAAMDYLVKAEKYVKHASDPQAGMLYTAQSLLYQSVFSYNNAIDAVNKAIDRYNKSLDTVKVVRAQINLAMFHLANQDKIEIDSVLNIIRSQWDIVPYDQREKYYYARLRYCLQYDTLNTFNVINDYKRDIQPTDINWLAIANAYYDASDLESALTCINNYKAYHPDTYSDHIPYHTINAHLNFSLKEYEDAAQSFDRYTEYLNNIQIPLLKTDTNILKERYENQIRYNHSKNMIVILLLTILVIVLSAFLFGKKLLNLLNLRNTTIVYLSKENSNLLEDNSRANETIQYYKELYSTVSEEKKKLTKLKKQTHNKEVYDLISERLEIIGNLAASTIRSGISRQEAIQRLEELISDREKFMKSNRAAFEVCTPGFIKYLVIHKLSQTEIDVCCLYCMGLNGAEISNYLDSKSFYNISSSIRQKLGLKRSDTNLDKYLISLMKRDDLQP